MTRRFYAYIIRDTRPEKCLEPIYVGKGRGNRAYFHMTDDCTNRRLKGKINKMKALGLVPKIEIFDCLSEDHAFFLEKALIALIGRVDLGKGTLCNMTDGGEGVTGMRHSPEARAIMSEKKKGIIPWNKGKEMTQEYKDVVSATLTGKKASEETKAKMSASHTGVKMPPRSQEHAAKLAEAQRGKKASPETKAKMVAAHRARYAALKAAREVM